MSDEILTEIRDLLRSLIKQRTSKLLESELTKPEDRKVYELTDSRSRAEIVKLTGVSAGKVSLLWQRWENLGLVVKDGQKYKRLV